MFRVPQGGIFLTVHLAITPAALAQLAQPPALPLVHVAYAIDAGGCLARVRSPEPPRGGLMGLSDCCAAPLPRAEALCRAIVNECRTRGYDGVLADFDAPRPDDRTAFLSRLGRALAARGLRLYCPLALPANGAALLVGTAVSGGSLRTLLEESVSQWGAQRLALDLERIRMDFPLPCPTGCGTPLTQEELLALRRKHPSSLYYSRELMANYFTYTEESAGHFVLFDDAGTLRQKIRLARELRIREAFLMYPEVADILPEIERP